MALKEAVSTLKTWAADAIVEYVRSVRLYSHVFITVSDLPATAKTKDKAIGTHLFSGTRR